MSFVNLKVKEDSKRIFKLYCKKYDRKMTDVFDNLVKFISARDTHPDEFFIDGKNNPFEKEGRILQEIKKNRETYISFQRTYEVSFNNFVQHTKTIHLYNAKRLIEFAKSEKDYNRYMVNLVSSLIMIDVNYLIVKQKINTNNVDLDELPKMTDVMAERLLEIKKVSPASINEAAKHITETYK